MMMVFIVVLFLVAFNKRGLMSVVYTTYAIPPLCPLLWPNSYCSMCGLYPYIVTSTSQRDVVVVVIIMKRGATKCSVLVFFFALSHAFRTMSRVIIIKHHRAVAAETYTITDIIGRTEINGQLNICPGINFSKRNLSDDCERGQNEEGKHSLESQAYSRLEEGADPDNFS